jgi:hypothetical protein
VIYGLVLHLHRLFAVSLKITCIAPFGFYCVGFVGLCGYPSYVEVGVIFKLFK